MKSLVVLEKGFQEVPANKIMKYFILTLTLLLMPFLAYAHPGNTASDGAHYCRTNCDYWGVPWNQRHSHGGGSTQKSTTPTPTVSTPTEAQPIPQPSPKPTVIDTPVVMPVEPPQSATIEESSSKTEESIIKEIKPATVIPEIENSQPQPSKEIPKKEIAKKKGFWSRFFSFIF